MTARFRACFLVSSVVLLAACGRPGDSSSGSPRLTDASAARVAPGVADQAPTIASSAAPDAPAGSTANTSSLNDQKLIRSAEISIEVGDVQNAMHAADSLVRRHGAMLAGNSLTRNPDGRRQAELDIRVPTDSFAATIAALRQLGDVRTETVNTQDVTKEYTDLETRLAVKEQEVGRLRSLLDNRTAKLTDILDVERELTRAVTELETMKGDQRYYDQQIALSTITLTLMSRMGSNSGQLTGPVAGAFRSSFSVIGTSLSGVIYLVAILLPWAIFALVAWWIFVRVRARTHSTERHEK